MEISSDVLVLEIENEFKDYNAEVSDTDFVTVRENVMPGSPYFYEHHNGFVESIEEFIMMHTEDWIVERTNANRIEGYHTVVLKRVD